MPSCVVKCCKNYSTTKKKCQGLTYHRFPVGNEPWKNDWVSIIRNSRGEKDWNPSKSSVVCSSHFDPCDLYTTKNGLVRVVMYAVPKRLLFKPPNVDEQPKEITSLQIAVHRILPAPAKTSDSQTTAVTLPKVYTTVSLPQGYTAVKLPPGFTAVSLPQAHSAVSLPQVQSQPITGPSPEDFDDSSASEGSMTLALPQVCAHYGDETDDNQTDGNNIEGYHNEANKNEHNQNEDIENIFQVNDYDIPRSNSSSPIEDPDLVVDPLLFDRPRVYHLKKKLLKKQKIVDVQKTKIKTLNQKVRRLEIRNRVLKDKLKALKNQKRLDGDL